VLDLKIAVLLPDLRVGGVEKMRLALAREWKHLGHEVIFIVLRDTGGLLVDVRRDFIVQSLQAHRMRAAVWKLRGVLLAEKPHLLLVGMWPLTVIGIISAKLASLGTRVFVSEHISFKHTPELRTTVGKLLFWFTVTFLYRMTINVICVSEGVKSDLAIFAKPPAKKLRVIYNPAYVKGKNKNVRQTEKRSTFTILSVGSLKDQKDHRTLIRAFSYLVPLESFRLVLVGDGPERLELATLVHEQGLSTFIEFAGEQLDLAKYFLEADVFVLSSRYEGFANVIVEAMSYGLQVVSTDCEHGPREILNGGEYGRLVPVSDARAMAVAIQASLAKPFSVTSIKERASEYSPLTVANQYLKLFGGE